MQFLVSLGGDRRDDHWMHGFLFGRELCGERAGGVVVSLL